VTDSIANSEEIILWALYDLGGAEQFVDVEDVFIRAFELAPKRLCWRTRPELINFKTCSLAEGALGRQTPKLLIKQGDYMRKISVDGLKWIEENFDRLAEELAKDRVVRATRRRSTSKLLTQVQRSPVYTNWLRTQEITGEKWRVAELLRCSPDNASSIFQDRITTLQSVAYAAGHAEVMKFLDELSSQRKEWFA
jgi:hypothetical protein